jgi:SAM-dependent methyltransferase
MRTAWNAERMRIRWPSVTGHASMHRMPTDHEVPGAGISFRLVSPSAGSADPPRVNDYDSFAQGYSAENEANLINAYYERPAMLALAGDVAGRRILDAGCGSGPLFAALRDRGAIVTGFDSSAGMLELARRRLGDDADLRVANLGSPLPFPDAAFDDVTASLVLHYLEDWGPALAELRRVLKPGGRLIASVDHPFAINLMHREDGGKPNYFATANRTEEWTIGGQTALLSFWDRPLHAMTDAFTAAGFRIAVISEPAPAPAARELFPDVIAAKPRFLCFLFFVLQADLPAMPYVGCCGSGSSQRLLTPSRLKALITVMVHATAWYSSSVKNAHRLFVDLVGYVLGLGQPGHRVGERQRGAFLLAVKVCFSPGAEQVDAPFGLAEPAGVAGTHVQAGCAAVAVAGTAPRSGR